MITRFLSRREYAQFASWLKSQDADTLVLYFGIAAGDAMIDALVERIIKSSDKHYFLIAEQSGRWLGVVHIATSDTTVEFGITVDRDHRGQGIGSQLIEQALIWARNRGYQELFMHCLGWNKPIQHLCRKHGLQVRDSYGDYEVTVRLEPPSPETWWQEILTAQRNFFNSFYHRIYN